MGLVEEKLTEKIIGACMDVSTELGGRVPRERVPEGTALGLGGVPLEVTFRGEVVGEFQPDILVEGKVIVEIKAVRSLAPEHEAQLINYLKATGVKVGPLVNFGRTRLDWRRFVY